MFSERKDKKQVELGTDLAPAFNEQGLIPCITTDAESGEVLMFAWMNREALQMTLKTKKATYFSRSRNKIWIKGETSGLEQNVRKVLIDCDQDVVLLKVKVKGEGVCHRGYRSCFYREVSDTETGRLNFVEDQPAFNPDDVYDNKKKEEQECKK